MTMAFFPDRTHAPGRKPGKIWLIGAGPGDPELLTLRAARLLGAARLVVHDGLVAPAILALAPANARLFSVAKQRGRHTMPQSEIDALLVAEALTGHDVIRLKGGDPFIFGRGGEEAEAARAAGIEVEVVPGISAGIGAAAAGQIPLTHRDGASVVSFVTGQCRKDSGKGLTEQSRAEQDWAEQNWSGLAGPGRTLVVYMGLANAGAIAAKLIAEGIGSDTPVAVVENATRPDMRVLRADLRGLGDLVERERVTSPAIIIIGAVAAQGNDSARALARASCKDLGTGFLQKTMRRQKPDAMERVMA